MGTIGGEEVAFEPDRFEDLRRCVEAAGVSGDLNLDARDREPDRNLHREYVTPVRERGRGTAQHVGARIERSERSRGVLVVGRDVTVRRLE